MPKKPKTPRADRDVDVAGYDHGQRSADMGRSGTRAQRSDTYRDKDHDGGWSNQVGMDDYEDRSGGDAYRRMSRGVDAQSYGRGPGAGSTPFDRGDTSGHDGHEGHGGQRRHRVPVDQDHRLAPPQSRPDSPDPHQPRSMFDRAGDGIRSWFGDELAAQRLEDDHRGKGPKGYKRSDSRILEDVNDILSEDSHVDASDISVSIMEGEVTLSGTVTSKRAKRRAEDCADAVTGVQHVQNNLRVATAGGTTDAV